MKVYSLFELSFRGNKDVKRGAYRFSDDDRGVYSSINRAKEVMRSLIARERENRLGFWIFERKIDEGRVGKFKEFCLYDSVRVYYADGRLMCYSPYDTACRREFCGRPADKVPVKPGELAWCATGGEIIPVLVGSGPLTSEGWLQIAKRAEARLGKGAYGGGRKTGLDYTDDSYLVYDCECGHRHPEVWRLFPYFGKISKRNMARLQSARRWFQGGAE